MREQAVAVLGEGRGVEDLLIDRQSDEPAKQKVELQPFDQLPLRADRIEKLQQRRPQQSLRRDRRAPARLVERRKRSVEFSQRPIGYAPHGSQRIVRSYPRLDVDIGKKRPARPISATHRSLAIRLRPSQGIMQREQTPATS